MGAAAAGLACVEELAEALALPEEDAAAEALALLVCDTVAVPVALVLLDDEAVAEADAVAVALADAVAKGKGINANISKKPCWFVEKSISLFAPKAGGAPTSSAKLESTSTVHKISGAWREKSTATKNPSEFCGVISAYPTFCASRIKEVE